MNLVFKNVRVTCKYPRAMRPLLGVSSLVSGSICWLSTPQHTAVFAALPGPQPLLSCRRRLWQVELCLQDETEGAFNTWALNAVFCYKHQD